MANPNKLGMSAKQRLALSVSKCGGIGDRPSHDNELQAILNRLQSGEINAQQAEQQIRKLQSR
jgi:hypothetical protein